jgi:hypothetical protein
MWVDTTVCDKICLWLEAGWWFSLGSTLVSSTSKTDHHDIAEKMLNSISNSFSSEILENYI